MTKFTDMFEQDAGALQVKDEDLSSVGALAKRAKELEKEILELETVIDERKKQQRKLLEETIPAMLQELGLKEFKMTDGSQITVKAFYGASIPEESVPRPTSGFVSAALMTSSRTLCQYGLAAMRTSCARHS